MASDQDRDNLLDTLKQLYFRIIGLRAKTRTRSSTKHGNNMDHSQNIVTPLSKYIDKLASKATNNPAGALESQSPEGENHSHDNDSSSEDSSPRAEMGELSLHLKESHQYTGPSPSTGDRLKQSTWEHFHAAIRTARQGDVKMARLHMDLANNALKEAAQYLSESEYSQFSKEVMTALEGIKD